MLFDKKKNQNEGKVFAPAGAVVPISQAPDKVFLKKYYSNFIKEPDSSAVKIALCCVRKT